MTTARRREPEQLWLIDPPLRAGLVGLALRAAREGRGMSLRALARMANVDPSALSRWERGDEPAPVSVRRRLADALESDPDDLELAALGVERGSVEHLRDVVPYSEDEAAQAAVQARLRRGYSTRQIAELLHLADSTVELALQSAYEALRARAEAGDADVMAWLCSGGLRDEEG